MFRQIINQTEMKKLCIRKGRFYQIVWNKFSQNSQPLRISKAIYEKF